MYAYELQIQFNILFKMGTSRFFGEESASLMLSSLKNTLKSIITWQKESPISETIILFPIVKMEISNPCQVFNKTNHVKVTLS